MSGEADDAVPVPRISLHELEARLWWWRGFIIPHPRLGGDGVTDGDNVWVEIDEGWRRRKTRYIRLARINAPEIRGEERPEGLVSEARLVELLPLGTRVYLRTIKDSDNFGRFVADVYGPNPENDDGDYTLINDLLVAEGLAVHKDY